MTTVSKAIRSDLLKEYLGGKVNNVFKMITTELLRNQISFGGSVAQREPYSDIAAILLALDAEIVLHDGKTENTVPISQFYSSDYRTTLKKNLIKEILLQKYDKSYKFGMERFIRNATDIPLLNIAILAKVEKKSIKKINIVAGARPGPAERCAKAENFLNEKTLSQELAKEFGRFVEANINSEEDIRIGKEFRKYIAGVFAKRILLGFMEE
jgi:CO/xanthine dehydrogenase FAD-binding subunit